jgi:hypothetical protein
VLGASVILYLFVRYERRYRENYMWSFLIMFSLATGQYAHYNPIKGFIKIFIAGFFFFGLHINTAYHSYLINVLTNPRFTKQIDTVDDAIAFNMTFKAAENTRDFFMKNDSVRWTRDVVTFERLFISLPRTVDAVSAEEVHHL